GDARSPQRRSYPRISACSATLCDLRVEAVTPRPRYRRAIRLPPAATSAAGARGARHRRERTDLRLALRIRQVAELGAHAAGDCGRLASGLEAGEVRPIAPRERTAQPDTGLDRGVVHDVDRALVVGRALAESREVAEVAARGEHRRDARHFRDLVGVLQPFE